MKTTTVCLVAGVCLLLGVLGFGLTVDPNRIDSPLVGRPAPDFSLPNLSGDDSVRVSDFRGRVTVVNFWASWCIPCIDEHDVLLEAWQRYAGRDIQLIGVLYQDSPGRAEAFLAEHGGGWLQLNDANSRAAIEYGVYGVPETYVIDTAGTITYKKVGPLEGDELIAAIEDAMRLKVGTEP